MSEPVKTGFEMRTSTGADFRWQWNRGGLELAINNTVVLALTDEETRTFKAHLEEP